VIRIITLWNKPEYIQDAIDSVKAQTRQDIIHVMQKDEGIDWKGLYPPARWWNIQSFAASPDDYVCWLSDDDILLPNYVADLAGYLDKHPEAECVYGGSHHVQHHPAFEDRFIRELPCSLPFPLLNSSYTPGYRIDGGCFMVRRTALNRVPYPYCPEGLDTARVCDAVYMDKLVQYFSMVPVQAFVMKNRVTPRSSHFVVTETGETKIVNWLEQNQAHARTGSLRSSISPFHGGTFVDNITAVIVSLNTYELTRKAADSLVTAYPDINLIMIDQGSIDHTPEYLQACAARPRTRCVYLSKNIGHGPALHMATQMATTPYLFTLDSDCEVQSSGFLEQMVKNFDDGDVYAVGELMYVRSADCEMATSTFQAWPDFTPYLHPRMGLYRLSMYKQIRPFIHHGGPAIFNMVDARSKNWKCINFPIQDYVNHLGGRTWQLYGNDWNVVSIPRPIGW
jgi:GT2 family glycosyltransferase